MTSLTNMEPQALNQLKTRLMETYRKFQSKNVQLDMTRGKPCAEQLDLSMEMLDPNFIVPFTTADGTDCRNYGGLDGIPEAKKLFSQLLDVQPEEIIIGGNASLNLMHDIILRAMVMGVTDSETAWGKESGVKFLCPSPGYDRHFAICEYLNIDMIPIEMNAKGPDMARIERLVAEDEGIKGMWCVPKYSNPSGITYTDDVVNRLARMKTAAKDFRLFWDNAYSVHDFDDHPVALKNILTACKNAGNGERVFIFGSTSKITFPGAGVSVLGASKKNIDSIKSQLFFQTIGPDKLNQLRHVRFFKNVDGIKTHMKKHAAILKPRFDLVQNMLESELEGKNVAEWSRPNGGYFVSIDTFDGCAKAVVKMAAQAGVKLTPAGATYPYGKDPRDRNIRIAPSYPTVDDIRSAMEILTVCIQMVSIDHILNEKTTN